MEDPSTYDPRVWRTGVSVCSDTIKLYIVCVKFSMFARVWNDSCSVTVGGMGKKSGERMKKGPEMEPQDPL